MLAEGCWGEWNWRMARTQRIEYEGAVYHVTARGNERREIFRDDADREHFLRVLGESVGRFEVRLYPRNAPEMPVSK